MDEETGRHPSVLAPGAPQGIYSASERHICRHCGAVIEGDKLAVAFHSISKHPDRAIDGGSEYE